MTVTINASDSESGIEGIYSDGSKVSNTSSYQYTAVKNEERSFYANDFAGRTSDETVVSITNIDKNAPPTEAALF